MPTKGYTLIEVLLVVIVVAILAAVIVMHMDLNHGRHVLREGADALAMELANIEEEAVGRQEVWGAVVDAHGLALYRLQESKGLWIQVTDRSWLQPRFDVPEGLSLRLQKAKPQASSSSSMSSQDAAQGSGGTADQGQAIHPDLYMLPSGEVTPATLILGDGEEDMRIVLDAIGHVEVQGGKVHAPAS